MVTAAFLAQILRFVLYGRTGKVLCLGPQGVRDMCVGSEGGAPPPWPEIQIVRTFSAKSSTGCLLEVATAEATITVRGAPLDRARFNRIRGFVVSKLPNEATPGSGEPQSN